MKTNNVQGDSTDISAETKPLVVLRFAGSETSNADVPVT